MRRGRSKADESRFMHNHSASMIKRSIMTINLETGEVKTHSSDDETDMDEIYHPECNIKLFLNF